MKHSFNKINFRSSTYGTRGVNIRTQHSIYKQNQVLLKHECKKVKSIAKKVGSKRKIVLLGSSHGREIGLMLKESLGKGFDIVGIFKPNTLLGNVVEDLGKLLKDLTKQDHIVVVGGPGNSLDRNYNYSIEDIHYIAERTTNTNVEIVNLFQRHDRPWMNGRVRSMNLRLDRALMRRDMSHIGIIDAASIAREDFMTQPPSKFSRQQEAYTSYC
jgi:hypothetical protein